MKKYFVLCIAIAGWLSLSAQTPGSADALFQQGQYLAASKQYERLMRVDPTYPLYLYRYARCHQEMGNDSIAIAYFEKAGERYVLRNYYLGHLYLRNYRFEEAAACLETYLSTIEEGHANYATTQAGLQQAQFLSRYMRHVELVQWLNDSIVSGADVLQAHPVAENKARRIWAEDGVLLSANRLLEGYDIPDTLNLLPGARIANPCLLSDGMSLYFAAQTTSGNGGLGGWDIFFTRFNPATNNYLNPSNMGMPWNSAANEYALYIDEQAHIGYLLSDRRCDSTQTHIYTFIPSTIDAEKMYLRDTTESYLQAYAQLLAWPQLAVSLPVDDDIDLVVEPLWTPEEQEEVEPSPFAEEEANLAALRARYAEANEEEREQLRPIILTAEQTLRNLKRDAKKGL